MDIVDFMEFSFYKSITINYLNDGVREIKLWSRDASRCKTMIIDPRWDDEK